MTNDFNKLLIVAAHPDDEVLGCGGLISILNKRDYEVKIVFLAEGSSVRFDEVGFESEIAVAIKEREYCALSALKKLGVNKNNIHFSSRKCCKLDTYPILELTKEIEKHIAVFKPTCLITHNQYDANIDHRKCYEAILPALRPVKKNTLSLAMSFEIISSTEWNYNNPFSANYFIDISDVIEDKIKACLEYRGEILKENHSRSINTIKTLASYRGQQAGYKYAEAFNLIFKR